MSERVTFLGQGGVRLVGDAWGPPDGPPVVLLHGGGQTRHSWGGAARVVGEAGHRAIALDARGHGDSAWVADGDYELWRFAEDLDAVRDALNAPPVVVGASLGGISGLVAAGEGARGRYRALVLVDIAATMRPEGVERVIGFMSAYPEGFESLQEAADVIAAYLPHRRRPRNLDGLRRNLVRGDDGRWRWHWDPRFLDLRGPNRRLQRSEQVRARLEAAARGLRLPTLLVRGRMSQVIDQEDVEHFLRLAPHARFTDVAEAGHMVAGDVNDCFTAVVADFLSAIEDR